MAKEPLTFTPLGQILSTVYPDFDNWLVKDLVPLGGLTIFSGPPASFKSYVSQHLALCVANKVPFLGEFDVPSVRKVLYFDKEGRPRYIQNRFNALGASGDPYIEMNQDDDFYLDNDEDVDRLLAKLRESDYITTGLIVFDSLIRFHHKDENAAVQMAQVFRNAKRIANLGPAVVILQHSRKEFAGMAPSVNSMRGSGEILAAADAQFSLSQDRKQGVISFVNYKMREAAELDPFAVKVVRKNDDPKGVPVDFQHSGAYDKDKPKLEEMKDTLIDLFKERDDEFSREDIYTALGEDYSKALANKGAEALVDEGYFSRRVGKGNKRLYSRIKQEGEAADISVDKLVESTL